MINNSIIKTDAGRIDFSMPKVSAIKIEKKQADEFKPTADQRKILRVFLLVNLMCDGKFRSCVEIAEILHIHSVRRYMALLREVGFDVIVVKRGVNTLYKIGNNRLPAFVNILNGKEVQHG